MCRAPIEIIVIGLQWATGEIEQVVGIFVTPARGLKIGIKILWLLEAFK